MKISWEKLKKIIATIFISVLKERKIRLKFIVNNKISILFPKKYWKFLRNIHSALIRYLIKGKDSTEWLLYLKNKRKNYINWANQQKATDFYSIVSFSRQDRFKLKETMLQSIALKDKSPTWWMKNLVHAISA